MSTSAQQDPPGKLYREYLDTEYMRVMLSDAVAYNASECARKYNCDEATQMKAAIVALSNANFQLTWRIKDVNRKENER